MQTVSQAIELVSHITGTARGRANQFGRALIDAGILPKSAGRDIKKIDGSQLLPLLAAVAMADKANEAAKVAEDFASLPCSMEDSDLTLAAAFGSIMAPNSPWKHAEIEFSKTANGYTATITGQAEGDNGDVNAMLPFWRSPSWGGFCKASFTVSREGIALLRALFNREAVEGMQFKLAPRSEQ